MNTVQLIVFCFIGYFKALEVALKIQELIESRSWFEFEDKIF